MDKFVFALLIKEVYIFVVPKFTDAEAKGQKPASTPWYLSKGVENVSTQKPAHGCL